MNEHVDRVSAQVLGLYEMQKRSLSHLAARELVELEHEMEHLRNHAKFSIRVGAEITRTAAVMRREEMNAPALAVPEPPKE